MDQKQGGRGIKYSKKKTTLANGSTRCYYYKTDLDTRIKVRVKADEYKRHVDPPRKQRGGKTDETFDATNDNHWGWVVDKSFDDITNIHMSTLNDKLQKNTHIMPVKWNYKNM